MVSWLTCVLLPVSILLSMLTPSVSNSCSSGVPGLPGAHGANGKDGSKGEKGDPGEATQPLKGAKGEMGILGRPGRPGPMGGEGELGPPGPRGPKGLKGAFPEIPKERRSVFSYKRSPSERTNIFQNRIVEFDSSFSPEMDDSLTRGLFKARLAGLYYFVYHVSAAQTACLCIKKKGETVLNLCDLSHGVLVTSGSVVLELKELDTVGVYVCYKDSKIISRDTDSVFTGFLLFPS
ncbi:complement C1q subcomponent subunit B [Trichomycterus rosablanca]|uniref:complement C1q subcomponent subunit B n=1 Tax=Trichomycterus rosablanca TaxID=2290929 RepID=UPI002F34F6E1